MQHAMRQIVIFYAIHEVCQGHYLLLVAHLRLLGGGHGGQAALAAQRHDGGVGVVEQPVAQQRQQPRGGVNSSGGACEP